MSKKLVALVLAVVFAVGMLATAMAEGEVKTLKMLWFSDGIEGQVMQELIKEYEAEHPDIHVELMEVAYADYDNKIRTLLAAGEQPALARTTNVTSYLDYLVDMNEYMPEGFTDRFADLSGKVWDGRLVAVPMEFAVVGCIYNKTAFEKAGVAVPQSPDEVWTWEEFDAALKQVIASGACKYGLVVDKTTYRFCSFLYEAGGSLLTEDLSASAFDSDATRRAVKYFYDMHKDGVIPTSVWLGAENPNNLFRSGQVACHIGGSWLLTNYDKEISDFEWGVTYLPKDVYRATISGSKHMAVYKNTGLEKEACEFVEWFTRYENFSRWCEPNFFINGVIAPEGTEETESKYAADFAVFSDSVATNASLSGEWNLSAVPGLISTDMVEKLSAVLSDQMSVEDFVTEMDDLINEAIADLQ